jgi:hypothetical protein
MIEAKVTAGKLTDCLPMNGNPGNAQDQWKFTSSGGYPANADGFCWH